MNGVRQTLEEKQCPLRCLLPETYDDALDQWVLDEPKVCVYEDFIQIGIIITTKSYASMKDHLTKVLQVKVTLVSHSSLGPKIIVDGVVRGIKVRRVLR